MMGVITAARKSQRPHITDAGQAKATVFQDVWWKNADGLTILIDNMDEGYRRNCANKLIDWAARLWIQSVCESEQWFFLVRGAAYADDFDQLGDDELWPSRTELLRRWRKRQDKGEHLDWMRSTPLYRRLAGLS